MALAALKPAATPVLLKPFAALTGALLLLLVSQPVPHWSDWLNDRDD